MNGSRSTLPLLLVAAAALLSWWLYQQVQQDRPRNDGSQRHDPDAFIDDVDLSNLDASGQLTSRLWAKRMQHYPDDDSTTLDKPRLEMYRPAEPPWNLHAQQGWISSGGDEVLLEGDVKIRRDGKAGIHPVDIETGKLLIFPERDYAETDVAITYRSTGLEVHSIGMRAYLEKGQVELLNQVRAVHQPQGKP
ncbi:MAG: LPS export ABC transporter periplasmic protein LptC [Gammaproteobacteria bacterium]|nr:LPS export ABC transporter periplasmic protein LptC [Gammaproteobacteria bacterium]MBU2477681.1 LPS export ABC transporter periplasmic protein LptC [Gammaproteobacteria bacterium]